MTAFHHAFSFDGGGMMGKVHEFVVSLLPWDGRVKWGGGDGNVSLYGRKGFLFFG